MRINFYSTECHTCRKYVRAGEGVWSGETYCEPCHIANELAIQVRVQTEIAERIAYWITSLIPTYLAEANIKPATWQNALIKITNGRTTDLNEMTHDEVEKAMREIGKRAQAKETKIKREALKADGKCLRCGGAGRSDNWSATGYTCYACNGSGKAQEAVK